MSIWDWAISCELHQQGACIHGKVNRIVNQHFASTSKKIVWLVDMKPETLNFTGSKKWDWKFYLSSIAIGTSIVALCITGFARIVVLCASIFSFGIAVYCLVSIPRQRILVYFFSAIGLMGFAVYLFAPQTFSFFGWDEMASAFLSGLAVKMALFTFYNRKPTAN